MLAERDTLRGGLPIIVQDKTRDFTTVGTRMILSKTRSSPFPEQDVASRSVHRYTIIRPRSAEVKHIPLNSQVQYSNHTEITDCQLPSHFGILFQTASGVATITQGTHVRAIFCSKKAQVEGFNS